MKKTYKVIWERGINVDSRAREPSEHFEDDDTRSEIKALLRSKYIAEVKP